MKEQGSAALRIVAFAVALAVVLGLASVMFNVAASAETADDVVSQLGTLGNYDCIKFKAGQKIDFKTLYEQRIRYNSNYVYGAVFGYKDGKFVKFTNNNFSIRPQTNSDYFDVYFCGSLLYGSWVYGDKPVFDSVYFQYGVYNNLYCSMCIGVKGADISVQGSTKLADSSQSFYDSVGDTLYLVYTSSNSTWDTSQENDFRNGIINNLTDSNYKDLSSDSSVTSSTAKFITCASFTNPDGSFPLWVKDFIAEGHQYPMFTFAISDNGNNHKYSMVLSYNDNDLIAPFIVGMYDDLSDSDKRTGFKLTTAISKKFHVPGFVGITNMSDVLKKGCINIFEKNWVNLTYNRAFNLNSSDMDFTDNTGNKVYTITLSDYSAIKANTFYKAELIDLTTSEVLDVTYFTSAQSFNKSDSGNGTKIYNYGDKSDQMWDDLKNNTPSVDPSKGDNFNVGGDVDTNFDNLSNLNINDIISGLRTSISSVSVFFQACWSLFPAAFWSIILLGVSLIIILRILGR